MGTALVVSQEELLVLCAIGHVPPLAVLAESSLHTLTPEQRVIATITAERALRARGLITRSGDTVQLTDEHVRPIVTLMARAQCSIALRLVAPDQPLTLAFVYLDAEMAVFQQLPAPDLHQLQGPLDLATAVEELLAVLALPDSSGSDAALTVTLPEAVLNQAADLSMRDEVAAQQLIQASAVTPEAGARLLALLRQPVSRVGIAVVPRVQQDAQGIALLYNDQGIWLTAQPPPSLDTRTLQLVTARQVRTQLFELVASTIGGMAPAPAQAPTSL